MRKKVKELTYKIHLRLTSKQKKFLEQKQKEFGLSSITDTIRTIITIANAKNFPKVGE